MSTPPCTGRNSSLPSGVEAWLVTRYGDAKQALADPRLSKNPAHHDEPAQQADTYVLTAVT